MRPRLSAKDFRQPLLHVLGELTNRSTGIYVPATDTYDRVLSAMKITDSAQYGENNDQPMVHRWIQWAFKNLLSDKLAVTAGKGTWGISEAGVEHLNREFPLDTTPNLVPNIGLHSLPIGPLSRDFTPSGDPDLHQLRANKKNTPCFGLFSHSGTICEMCPIRISCIGATSDVFVMLASELAKEDVQKSAKPSEAASKKAGSDKWAKSPMDLEYIKKLSEADTRKFPSAVAADCGLCMEALPVGSEAIWVQGKDSSNQRGICHVECFREIRGTK